MTRPKHPYPPETEEALLQIYRPYMTLQPFLVFQPYLSISLPINVTTPAINTDERGYRFCYGADGRRVSYQAFMAHRGKTGLIVGGSVPFGSATTHDRHTLNNRLNQQSGRLWWNAGVLGCNSFVEVLRYLLLKRPVDKVVSLSGVNDLYIHLGSPRRFPWNLPFEGEESFYTWNMGNTSAPLEDSPDVEALDDFIALCHALSPLPSAKEALLIVESAYFRARYAACLQALAHYFSIMKRLCGDNFVYILNPNLLYAKTPNPEERAFFDITLTRLPHYNLCILSAIHTVFPHYRQDVRALAEAAGVTFLDGNDFQFSDATCFIDYYHMTDQGFAEFTANLLQRAPHLAE
jgi:hypothetical protein